MGGLAACTPGLQGPAGWRPHWGAPCLPPLSKGSGPSGFSLIEARPSSSSDAACLTCEGSSWDQTPSPSRWQPLIHSVSGFPYSGHFTEVGS